MRVCFLKLDFNSFSDSEGGVSLDVINWGSLAQPAVKKSSKQKSNNRNGKSKSVTFDVETEG